ncbi:MAG: gliding motility protein GldC [Ignavibacterium sp.]|nr:gliding motility protein GldC [Ignavibacterium sp.]
MPKTSEIKILVTLDDTKMPEKILWKADDSEFTDFKAAKTVMLSLWDKDEKVTLGFDIWTKEMIVQDMNILFHQTFSKMADTYLRATNNTEISDLIKKFAAEFADKLNLFEDDSKS